MNQFKFYASAFGEIAIKQQEQIKAQEEEARINKEKRLDLEYEVLRLKHELRVEPLRQNQRLATIIRDKEDHSRRVVKFNRD